MTKPNAREWIEDRVKLAARPGSAGDALTTNWLLTQAIIDYLCEAQGEAVVALCTHGVSLSAPCTSCQAIDFGTGNTPPGCNERGPGSAEHGAPSGEDLALRDKLCADIYQQSVEGTVRQRDEARAEVERLKRDLSFEEDSLAAAGRNGLTLSVGLSAAREEIARLQVACLSIANERRTIRDELTKLQAANSSLNADLARVTSERAQLLKSCQQALQALQPAKRDERDAAIAMLSELLDEVKP